MRRRPLARDAIRLGVVWIAVFGAVTAWMFLTTEGEPVCEGPLIVWVKTSLPPHCNTLTEGYEQHLPALLLGTLILAALLRVVIVLVGMGVRRSPMRSQDSDPLALVGADDGAAG